MTERKIAIVVSGRTRNFPLTLQNFMDNVVVPNNADIFLLFQRDTRLTCEHLPIPDNDVEYIKGILGDHLKHISFTDDDYDLELSETIDSCTNNISNLIDLQRSQNGYIMGRKISTFPIDQYLKIRKVAMILEEYEKTNNVKYDIIARSRIDHVHYENVIDLNTHLERAKNDTGEFFFTGGVRGDFETRSIYWASELLVFGTHGIMVKILKNFILEYGKFRLDEKKHANELSLALAPEMQFGLYLNQFNGQCNLYKLDNDFLIGYKNTGCSGCSHYVVKIQ